MKDMTTAVFAGALGTVAALCISFSTTPKAESRGIYLNSNGASAVVVDRGSYDGPRGNDNDGPRY